MRCTFYVEGDLFEPWEENLSSGPPHVGKHLTREGLDWVVKRVVFTMWPGSPDREASVYLIRDDEGAVTGGTNPARPRLPA
jgi:hypothetical protein